MRGEGKRNQKWGSLIYNLNKKVISGQDNAVTKKGVTYMGQDEKIREAQKILNWAIMHLNGNINFKVIKYKHQNYRVQVFTKENKSIMPVQVPEEWINGTNPEENFIHDKLGLLLKNLERY